MARPAQPQPPDPHGLGQRVRFKWVVSRTYRADGKPTRQNMGRIRKGIIVAQRNVYDHVADTHPPQLANPQPVFVVAVSLHRQYRVFPDDLLPSKDGSHA